MIKVFSSRLLLFVLIIATSYGIVNNFFQIYDTFTMREENFNFQRDEFIVSEIEDIKIEENLTVKLTDECQISCKNKNDVPFLLLSGAGSVVGPKFCWNGTNMMSSKVNFLEIQDV